MVSFLLTSNNNPGAHLGEMNNYHVVLKHISKQTKRLKRKQYCDNVCSFEIWFCYHGSLVSSFPPWGTSWIFPLFLLFVMCFLTLTGRAMEWRQNQYVLWNSQLYRPRGSPWRGLWYC